MKRVLGALVCLLMALMLSACSQKLSASSETFTYGLDNSNGAAIASYTGDAAELIIPSAIDGHPVKSIGGYAFRYNKKLTSIALLEGIESISDNAFEACSALTNVLLPEGLESIGSYAFRHCKTLSTVRLPDSIKAMGSNPFYGCEKLSKIIIDSNHPVFSLTDGVLFSKAEKKLITYPASKKGDSYIVPNGVKSIGDSAFGVCNFTSITLPEGLESIGKSAFEHCNGLTNITLPKGLRSIDENAFSWCQSIPSITLPAGLEVIGSRAFDGCINLTTVNLPDSVTTMGSNPFTECRKLEEIIISPNHPMFSLIDGVLFNTVEKALISYPRTNKSESYMVPDGVKSIGGFAFCNSVNLTSITLPVGLTSIGENAFAGCDSLTSITLPEGLESIDDGAFDSCRNLSSITLPASLTSIGDSKFVDIFITLTVKHDSYAEKWAKKNGYEYKYSD